MAASLCNTASELQPKSESIRSRESTTSAQGHMQAMLHLCGCWAGPTQTNIARPIARQFFRLTACPRALGKSAVPLASARSAKTIYPLCRNRLPSLMCWRKLPTASQKTPWPMPGSSSYSTCQYLQKRIVPFHLMLVAHATNVSHVRIKQRQVLRWSSRDTQLRIRHD